MESTKFILISSSLAGSTFIVLGYALSRLFKRNDVADVLWGIGFLFAAAYASWLTSEIHFAGSLILVLVTVWALRLSTHLGIRTFSKATEDIRYSKWRREWGSHEPLKAFLKVFLLQGCVLTFASLPVSIALLAPEKQMGLLTFLGVMTFVIGFLFESIGDAELAWFKRQRTQSEKKLLTKGLWGLSRHPNYFGESLIWWGLAFICLDLELGLALGLLAILSPVLMTFLLTRVSGVAMLEPILATREGAAGKAFADYVDKVPAFIPLRLPHVVATIGGLIAMGLLELIWLGWLSTAFYQNEAREVISVIDGKWQIQFWAAIPVYLAMAIGIMVFAVAPSLRDPELSRSQKLLQATFRGGLLGLVIYTVYDATNIAVLKAWPVRMAVVDMLWGTFLLAMGSLVSCSLMARRAEPPK